jgi:MinD-like ATPase involved in chromosome partitioning or flagellar assembly
MNETELALALSARGWSDDLHRFLADHGGARVRVTAMGPEDLFGETFDVLLIDDICSFLTPRLVELVKASGREVVGVYDPAEFADGKDRLLECGVADVVEAGAHPDEFLRVIGRVAQTVVTTTMADSVRHEPVPDVPERRKQAVFAIGGPAGGTGTTEVAIGIAARLGEAGRRVVLIDGDETNPSIAQRLGLAIHPNIRTAIDVLEHRTGPVTGVMHLVESIAVIPGLPNVTDWSEVRPNQVADLIAELSSMFDHVVVNVGSHIETLGFGASNERFGVSRRLVEIADRVIAVGLPSPVGVARTLRWLADADRLTGGAPIDVLINRAPRDQFRRGELVEEITRTYQPASFGFIPSDDVVERAAWDGTLVGKGRFRKALDRWVDRFVPEVAA